MTSSPPLSDEPSQQSAPLDAQALREAAIRVLVDGGDLKRAAADALQVYGPEILRFLYVRLRARTAAEDAFSLVCEDLWVGLPGFGWRSSLRTWLFVLARNAACRHASAAQRDRKRETHADCAELAEAYEQVRTTTAAFLRTETKQRVRSLRTQLDEDQQTLLVLRVERGLSWRELAIVMGEVTDDAPEPEMTRASARVRTRYQAAKKRLRELAIEAGLIRAKANRV